VIDRQAKWKRRLLAIVEPGEGKVVKRVLPGEAAGLAMVRVAAASLPESQGTMARIAC
jgi:hypothetical protein